MYNEIATNPGQKCGNVDNVATECLNFAGGTKNACDDAELICCPAVTTTTSTSEFEYMLYTVALLI